MDVNPQKNDKKNEPRTIHMGVLQSPTSAPENRKEIK
jgi:hypothetical protein